jgi:heme o synthase
METIERVAPKELLTVEREPVSTTETLRVYVALTKPRITLMVVLTTIAGFCLASVQGIDWLKFLHLSIGIGCLSSGISTINQWMERDLDALMRRTQDRPLPAGRVTPMQAIVFGATLTLGSLVYLILFTNGLTALLGVITAASYLLLYTPLKTKTTLSTVLGAFPGAMPPLVGWAAARGSVSVEGWVLFAILFIWQFPHFLAIAWMYRDDYARAGIKMLPVVEPEGRITGQQIVLYTLMLLPVSLMPTLLHLAGWLYFSGAIILGLGFLYFSIRAATLRTTWQARRLLLASVLYLPLLFALMVLNS